MAGGAGGLDGIALQRADQGMAQVGGAVFLGHLFHVAVRAGEHAGVHAASAHVGFKLGVLGFQLLDAGAGVGVVGKADGLVERVHIVRVHDGKASVGQGGGFSVRGEVVFHVALGAHGGLSGYLAHVIAHGVGQVQVGHGVAFAGGVSMTIVAAHGFVDVLQRVLKGNAVGFVAHFIHHMGVVRGFAGPAVGQLMGPAGGLHVFHAVEVAAGAAVVGVEGHPLVDGGDHGVFRHMVDHVLVLLGGHVAGVHVGKLFRPVGGVDLGHAGLDFHHFRGVSKGAACNAQQQRSHDRGQDDLSHG